MGDKDSNQLKENDLDVRIQALQYISEIEKELAELKALLRENAYER